MSARSSATEIVRRLQAAGHPAFWVGGCVRDQLLGKEPEDFDIATSALPAQIEGLFAHTVPVGRQFGVVLVVEAGRQFEVATFRTEGDYRDGRHPSRVAFSDAEADARRRDFTINGLFYDPVAKQLHDWVGGHADLERKTVRTIGAPEERFAEDRLRMLRAVRFAAQLGFEIDSATDAAIQTHALRILEVSAERIRDELLKLFRPLHAARGLELLRASGLLEHILPEIAATVSCEQSPEFHPEGTVYQHCRLMLAQMPPDASPSLPWAILLHDVAKPATASRDAHDQPIHFFGHEKTGMQMAQEILQRLRFPRKQIDEIAACVRYHMQLKDAPHMRKATLRRMLMRPTFPLELELHRLDCVGSHGRLDTYDLLKAGLDELERQPQLRPPLITGRDLIGLGMKPGPAMGELLAEIRDKQLQGELSTTEEARAWAAQRLRQRATQGPPPA